VKQQSLSETCGLEQGRPPVTRFASRPRLSAKRAPGARRLLQARRAPGRDHGACRAGELGGTRRARTCGTPRTALSGALASRGARWHGRTRTTRPQRAFTVGVGAAKGLLAVVAPRARSTPRASRPSRLVQCRPLLAGTKRAGFPRCALRSPGGGRSSLRPRSRRLLGSGALGLAGPGAAEVAVARKACDRGLRRGRPFDVSSYVTLSRGAWPSAFAAAPPNGLYGGPCRHALRRRRRAAAKRAPPRPSSWKSLAARARPAPPAPARVTPASPSSQAGSLVGRTRGDRRSELEDEAAASSSSRFGRRARVMPSPLRCPGLFVLRP